MGNKKSRSPSQSRFTSSRVPQLRCPTLHRIVEERDLLKLRRYVAKGGDLDVMDADGFTALHCAVLRDDEEMVETLLAFGSKLRSSKFCFSPIHFAVQTGNVNIVRSLIASGDSVNSCDMLGNTLLNLAIELNQADVVRLLLYKGAFTTAANLFFAIENGSLETCKLLLTNKPSIIKLLSFRTYRFTRKSVDCLKLLIVLGYKFNLERFRLLNRPYDFDELFGDEVVMPPPYYDKYEDNLAFGEFVDWLERMNSEPISLKWSCLVAFHRFCGTKSVEKMLYLYYRLPKSLTSFLLLKTFSV